MGTGQGGDGPSEAGQGPGSPESGADLEAATAARDPGVLSAPPVDGPGATRDEPGPEASTSGRAPAGPRGPEPAPPVLGPGAKLGQYELIRELGRGGMGVVYLGRDPRLGRRVAIKVVSHDDPTLAARFLAEARATARCRHDNVVAIHDVGEAPGCSFMVLEHLEGMTLRAWLRDRWQASGPTGSPSPTGGSAAPAGSAPAGPAVLALPAARVSPTLAVELVVLVVRALAHAHRLGLVHRDLKPENVMLTDDGSVKVVDFGIARLLGEAGGPPPPGEASPDPGGGLADPTREGVLVGTLPYMSPEQWGVGEIDARTDLWAVGIMLWELCTGRHPLAPLSRERLLSVRDLEAPMPSLAEACPHLGPLGGVVDRCLRKRADERPPSARALLDELEPLLPRHASRLAGGGEEPENPFVGLAPFQRSDAARFFGRGRDVAALVTLLRSQPLVTVAGASGAGKSSFVRAGVIPSLERSGQTWESFVLRPGRQPLAGLADLLAEATRATTAGAPEAASAPSPEVLAEMLRRQPGHLGAALRARCQRRRGHLLLFVDQFEELYTLGADRATREAFVRCLEGAADDASSPLRVVLAVRSDFLDRVAEDRAFTGAISRGLTLLAPLSRDQLRAALVAPVEAAGHGFEDESLVDALLDALASARSPLPLLQFTAARLWETRDAGRRLLTRAAFDALGGVEGALATRADAVLAGLSRHDQRLARAVLTGLVSADRTRAVVSLAELRSGEGRTVDRVVQHLAEARLVLVETDPERGTTVELVHESLVERWPRLVRWLDEDRDAARFRTRVQAAARPWDEQGRTDDLLWRGEAAAEAERWLARGPEAVAELRPRDRAFLDAVARLAARGRRRRRQAVGASFAFLCAVAVVVSLLAVRARREARQARNTARLATAFEHRSDPTLALALLREMEPGELPPRWSTLARWAVNQGVARLVLPHPDAVPMAAFSRDGTRLVTACLDRKARVWNAAGAGEPVVLAGHEDSVYSAAFSPDGARVVTASSDGTARIWRADGSGRPLLLSGHEDSVYSAAFSPDGTRVVTASLDGTARVWKADGSGQPVVLAGHGGWVTSAAFSPDGTRVVTASPDGTARVWKADGKGVLAVLTHPEPVWSASFSPDGRRVATAAEDKTVRIWNADGSGRPVLLTGHQAPLYSAAFSPDGARVVTGSFDRTARVWNADGTGQPVVLAGHQERVSSAAFGPDGKSVVTASGDGSARVWDVGRAGQPVLLKGHGARVLSGGWSPDASRVVTASLDRTARVWSADGQGQPVVLAGHEAFVYWAAFSPDGRRVVTTSTDKTARVWNADGSGRPVVLAGHRDTVHSAFFSPDGNRVLTVSRDRTVRVWNADGSGRPLELTPPGEVYTAAFSPDGSRILTASGDGKARVWKADGSGRPLEFANPRDLISAAFSPDGRRIVAASVPPAETWLWNADGSGAPLVIKGAFAAGTPGGGVFTPDGSRVLALTERGTACFLKADGTGVPEILRIPDFESSEGIGAVLSPDGGRVLTFSAAYSGPDPVTGGTEHWVAVWPAREVFTGLDDPALWAATTYCPPVELRTQLLGISEALAAEELRACRERLARAGGPSAPPVRTGPGRP